MKVSNVQEAHLRRIIRDARAMDPLITGVQIQKLVEKKANRFLSINYVHKLIRKVDGELVMRADTNRVEEKVMYLRERNRVICEELFRIAFPPANSPQPSIMERRKALEAIARIESMQAKLEMDFGVFERHLGTLDHDHRLKPIDPQALGPIIETFRVWSVAPEMRRIEPRRMIKAEATVITNEPTTQQPEAPGRNRAPIPRVTGAGLVTTE